MHISSNWMESIARMGQNGTQFMSYLVVSGLLGSVDICPDTLILPRYAYNVIPNAVRNLKSLHISLFSTLDFSLSLEMTMTRKSESSSNRPQSLILQHPHVLAAAALTRIHYEAAALERHAAECAWHYARLASVQHEWT